MAARQDDNGNRRNVGPIALVIMGVSGCGKTSLARGLAARLELDWLDADDFHPPANIDKMARGLALDDADRWPWLATMGEALADLAKQQRPAILACSALKARYRRALERACGLPLCYVLLEAPRGVLLHRLQARSGHFMGPALLDSQLATLEPLKVSSQILNQSSGQDSGQLSGQDSDLSWGPPGGTNAGPNPECGLILDATQPLDNLQDRVLAWIGC